MSGTISIKKMADAYAAKSERDFGSDRLNTVGASDVGQCLRKTWFAKNEQPRDPGYVDRYGARRRGDLIENHWVVPAILSGTENNGTRFLYAGREQRTFVDGYLSATPDGLLTGVPRDCLSWIGVSDIGAECIVVEIKSIDPRVDLKIEKPGHSFQVQAQIGLLRHATEHKPAYALISYVDASFLDDIREFAVAFDPAIYTVAKRRARQIMTATAALELSPEGKLSGGGECKYCPWSSHCATVTVAGMPDAGRPVLGDNAAAELKELRDRERALNNNKEDLALEHAQACEAIREFLRLNQVRGHRGDGWSVSWASVKGRTTLDKSAAEAAGLDLSQYEKTGKPGDRLTVT